MRPGGFLHNHFDAGETQSAFGRAMVEERYSALRRQVPIIYVLAAVNLCGLEIATSGQLTIGWNLPTAVTAVALLRIAQWLRPGKEITHELMLRRMRQTCLIAAVLCLSICAWCLHLLRTEDPTARMAILLFGGLTGIGTAYGLSSLPSAARLPLLGIALPLAGVAMLSNDPQLVGAALSLVVVTSLILRLLSIHNSHFTNVVRSRSTIAEQQALAESARQEAHLAATTDFLTKLPNRRSFVAAIEAASENNSAGFVVALLDLDRFKPVNDTFGHSTGDRLLEIVASRLVRATRKDALVARLGGDEFGLLFLNTADSAAPMSAATWALSEINRPAVINGRQFTVTACCGLALSRAGTAKTPSRILTEADLALYEAKRLGHGQAAIFEQRMETPHRRRAQIERALQMPDIHNNVYVVFQPIFDLRTGRVLAHEALARWDDPELGDVSPAEFVPIAEQLNIIGGLSEQLMGQAFTEAAQWPAPVRLSFNLSAVQLSSSASGEVILSQLGRAGLSPDRLQVEVTETALLANFNQARENLATLRSAGVNVVLDDFGAGYASIGYLRELRFDQIKLDGALIAAAAASADGKQLLTAVLGLCQALGVSAVGEGIEKEAQLKLLLSLGCAAGQGYWLQRPMTADATQEFSRSASIVSRRVRPARRSAA